MRRASRRLGSTVVAVLMLGTVVSVGPALASENGGSGTTSGSGSSGSDDSDSGRGGGGTDDATTGGATGTGPDDGASRAGAGGRVIVRGDCSKRADWKLKARPENGRLKVEFEVDSNKVGRSWTWTMRSNGFVVASGRRTTQGPSGSFSVERRTPDDSGRQRISATARNSRTREVCRASLTI